MSIESAFIKGLCAISFSLASRGFYLQGTGAMAIVTGIAASVCAILCVREVLR